MQVIPSIDLKDNRCVRLYQGDYDQVTVFSDRPAEVARGWERDGARLLHVVDLDGALRGEPQSRRAIREIVRAVSIPVELGGGLRSVDAVGSVFDLGVERVVIGTAAVEDRALLDDLAARWPGKFLVGIDARGGMVATRGWRERTDVRAVDLAREVTLHGAAGVVYTDIERDGTLTEPNHVATAEIVAAVAVPVIASGGVARLEHLERLQAVGAAGVIVGRALYTGAIRLADAIALCEVTSNE